MNTKFKIILADENKELLTEITQKLDSRKYEIVGYANDGEQLLELATSTNADIILMDVVLPKIDGFQVLEKMQELGIKSNIVIQTALSLDGFINKAISLGAKYYAVKPFKVENLLYRINDVVETLNCKEDMIYSKENLIPTTHKKNNILEEKISNIFITVGIPAHIKGYQFLREAIKLAIDSPEIINNITKKLYPSIATKFDTSSSKVERAIRHAIEVAWNRGKIENINNLFGIKVYSSSEKPTNGEFIALVADKMLIEGA